MRTATTTMLEELGDADVPDTDASTEVRQQLSQLADKVEQQVQVVEDAQVGSAGTAEELLQRVSVVAGALATIAADAKAAFVNMREAIEDTAIGDAFTSSPACQALGVGASGNS